MIAFLVAFVAAQHIGFLILEMFLWQTPTGRRIFRLSPEKARDSAALAMNQGLYNGFLAAGLIWSLVAEPLLAGPLRVFFLCCVITAGVFGAATVSRRIFYVQALPAVLALALSILRY